MHTLLTYLLVIVGLIFLWAVYVYNSLIATQNTLQNTQAGMDVQLRKRYDLIPNLVSTVKGYAAHEKAVFERITQLRATALNSQNSPQKEVTDEQISKSLKHIFAIAENYPNLKANENFLQLQAALNEVEAQIAAARRTYNAAVTQYNNTVESFPGSVIANAFGFTAHRWFENTDEGRQNPQVARKL